MAKRRQKPRKRATAPRRDRHISKPKSDRLKSRKPKTGNPTAVIARLKSELREALEHQTATSEVLKVISRSTLDLQLALDTLVSTAARLCDAEMVLISRREGRQYRSAASTGFTPEFHAFMQSHPLTPGRGSIVGRVALEKGVIEIADVTVDAEYTLSEATTMSGQRTALGVPLLREDDLIGVIVLARRRVEPFTNRQIELVRVFADQAVIAIENVRLFIELRESLEQQTATSEILQVISQSPTNVSPVLTAVAKAALKFCGAGDAQVALRDGDTWFVSAHEGPTTAVPGTRRLNRYTPPGVAMLDGKVVQVADLESPEGDQFPEARELGATLGFRAALVAPLLRDDVSIGSIALRRAEPGGFMPNQVELLKSFAAQAVIAIENVRLFTELRESLEQQTATADILRVISQSPTDVQPVLTAVAKAALRFCGAEDVGIFLREGEQYLMAAHEGPMVPEVGVRYPLSRQTAPGQAMLDSRTAHFADIGALDSVEYAAAREFSLRHGFKAAIAAPMLREGTAIGAVTLRRSQAGAFTQRQIELLESFAAQAVIALENTRLFTELQQRTDDLTESLEYQTATSDVLKVISRSTFDMEPVLNTLAATALQLCAAEQTFILRREGQVYRVVAGVGSSPDNVATVRQYRAYLETHPIEPGHGTVAGRAVLERRPVHIHDIVADPEYMLTQAMTLGNVRTTLGVPLLRDGEAIGVIVLSRHRVEPFTERQIELVRTFADQAVIAMENARLLSELRESLAQQTATAEILETINRSQGDLEPVFGAIVDKAMALCDAAFGMFNTFDGRRFNTVATRGISVAYARYRASNPPDYGPDTGPGRLIAGEDCVHDIDAADSDAYRRGEPNRRAMVDLGGARTILNIALRKEGRLLGMIAIYRQEVRPFDDKQIGLLQNFAAQAVIAMENARLLGEVRRREQELSVTFEHMGDGVLMLDAELRLAAWNRNFQRLLDVPDAFLAARPILDDYIRLLVERGEVGEGNVEAEIARYRTRAGTPWSAERTRADGRVIEVRSNPIPSGGSVVIYSDITRRKKAEAEIAAARDAAEAALERQTATADILKVIASSPSDTQPAFDAIAERANRLLDGLTTAVWRFEGEVAHLVAFTSINAEADAALRSLSPLRIADSAHLPLVKEGKVAQQANIEEMSPVVQEVARMRGYRSQLLVPLLAQGKSIGFFSVTRAMSGRFSDEDVQLLRTFADQGAIAIENARLFNDLRDSLERLKAAQANLIQSEKMASLGQLTAGIAHEIKNPLNFVNNFAGLSSELVDELKQTVDALLTEPDEDKRADLQDTIDLLTGNLAKIVEHGRRADGIVKSMLAHSRGGTGDWQSSNINNLVEEALNLAYHGARAQDKDFNVTLERDFDEKAKSIDLVPQDVTRVFLNLFGNSFYASRKRQRDSGDSAYRPVVRISTRDLGDVVEVRVRDNGIGISAEVRDKLFQPFFTTKPTGEGTGLGLSISYDIVTQQHGGSIEVESEPDQFTEFRVRLPRARRAAV